MGAMRGRTLGGVIVSSLLLALALAFVFLMGERVDVPSGLSRRAGSIGYYASRETDAALVLQRSGSDSWGFFEWPDRRIYGFFSGKAKASGKIEMELRGPSGTTLRLAFPPLGIASTLFLYVEGEKDQNRQLSLARQKGFDLNIASFGGMIDAKNRRISPFRNLFKPLSIEEGLSDFENSFFHIDALNGKTASMADLLNKKLRRGWTPLGYARDNWERFGLDRAAASASGTGNPSRVFAERQYLIPSELEFFSVATERYVFSGGAHGNTTAVFTTIDAKTGRALEAGDLFSEGWEKALEPLLRAEALRLLAGTAENERGRLSDYGFFEETIKPSLSFFLCRSGVGFHYDRYALAPYASGDFTFVLPWRELGKVLKEPWLTRAAQ